MRELKAAVKAGKTIVTVRETEVGKGAMSDEEVDAALGDDVRIKVFQNYLVGSPSSAAGLAGRSQLEAKSAIRVHVGRGEGDAAVEAATACKAALREERRRGIQRRKTKQQYFSAV